MIYSCLLSLLFLFQFGRLRDAASERVYLIAFRFIHNQLSFDSLIRFNVNEIKHKCSGRAAAAPSQRDILTRNTLSMQIRLEFSFSRRI